MKRFTYCSSGHKPIGLRGWSFFCTMNIYTFHYYLKSLKPEVDKRLDWYRKYKFVTWFLMLTGCVAIGYLIITHFETLFSSRNIAWTLVIPLLSLAYSFPFMPGGKALAAYWLAQASFA
jgi:hypothetical protein